MNVHPMLKTAELYRSWFSVICGIVIIAIAVAVSLRETSTCTVVMDAETQSLTCVNYRSDSPWWRIVFAAVMWIVLGCGRLWSGRVHATTRWSERAITDVLIVPCVLGIMGVVSRPALGALTILSALNSFLFLLDEWADIHPRVNSISIVSLSVAAVSSFLAWILVIETGLRASLSAGAWRLMALITIRHIALFFFGLEGYSSDHAFRARNRTLGDLVDTIMRVVVVIGILEIQGQW